MTASEPRSGAATTAFWLLAVGAVLLMLGGVMAATVGFDALRRSAPPTVSDQSVRNYLRLYRGAGVLFAVAAAALAGFAARARAGDARYRRAATALALAIVMLVGVAAVFAGTHILALLSLLPIIAGTLMMNRRAVAPDV
ncbi:MAG: hypothetical protein ACKVP6_00625 [Mycobacterium sp.]